jgi:amino acid transporter
MVRFGHKVAFGVGMAFSASCFTALGMLMLGAGSVSVYALSVSFLLMLVIIAAVSELASMFPSAVGLRTYTKIGIGESASLLAVVLYLCLVLLVAGIEMRVFLAVSAQIWPGIPMLTSSLAVFAAVVTAHLFGWQAAAWVQTGLVILLVGAVVALAGPHLSAAAPAAPVQMPARDLGSAIALGLFLFASVEWITSLQVSNLSDAKGIPRVLLVACTVLAVLFATLVAALLHLAERGLPIDATTPQRALLMAWPEPWGAMFLVGVTALAMLSTFHAGLACSSRLLYMLSREGLLPSNLSRTNADGTPVTAVLTSALACLVSVAVVMRLPSLDGLAEAGALAIATVYMMYLVSAANLRTSGRRRCWAAIQLPRPLLWAVAGLLGALMVSTCWDAYQHGLLLTALLPWIASGIAVALMRGRRRLVRPFMAVATTLDSSERKT